MMRDAFGMFATGVTVITAVRPDGHPVGITANSFASVSLDPPLILWCIARESVSVAAFAVGSAFAVTMLGEREKAVAPRPMKRCAHQKTATAMAMPSWAGRRNSAATKSFCRVARFIPRRT